MDLFDNIGASPASDPARRDEAGLQQHQVEQRSFEQRLNELQGSVPRPVNPTPGPPPHSPAPSVYHDEILAAADRGARLPAESFASAKFWQGIDGVTNSPAPNVDQEELPQSGGHAVSVSAGDPAIGGACLQDLASLPPPVNLPGVPLRSAPHSPLPRAPRAGLGQPPANQPGGPISEPPTEPTEARYQAVLLQRTALLRKRERRHPDELLFNTYRRLATAKGNQISQNRISKDIAALRKFSVRLAKDHQSQIAGRIHDRQLDSLVKLCAAGDTKLLGQINSALGRLRQAQAEGQVIVGRNRPSTEDDEVFADYHTKATTDKVSETTVKTDLATLRKFSAWLAKNHQSQIRGRIQDQQLDSLARDYAGNDPLLLRQINFALTRLRQASAGKRVTVARGARPVTQDDEVFADYHTKATAGNVTAVKTDLAALRKFSAWLAKNHQSQISGRIQDRQLDSLARDFAGSDPILLRHINLALIRIRQASAGERMTVARKPSSRDDEELFATYEAKATADKINSHTVKTDIVALRKFSKWLAQNHRTQIADRLESPELDALAKAYAGREAWRITPALRRLRQTKAEQRVTVKDHRPVTKDHRPVTEDTRVIEAACNEAASKGYYGRTIRNYRPVLLRFNDWLTENFGKGVARIEPAVLNRAVEEYKKNESRGFRSAWSFFQRFRQMSAANEVLHLAANGQAGWRQDESRAHKAAAQTASLSPFPLPPADPSWNQLRDLIQKDLAQPSSSSAFAGAQQASSFQEFSSAPHTPFEGAWDWLTTQMQSSTPSSARSPSSDIYRGLDPLVDLPSTPSSARSPSSDIYRGLNPLVDLPSLPSSARSPSSDIYRGLDPLVDLPSTPHELRDDAHYAPAFPSTSTDAQIAALNQTASFHGHGGLELGARDWLSDEHIAADYMLLIQDLQRDNPDLASRTRLVDPLIAHYHLRLGSQSVATRAFQHIVHDHDGNDTADFLFLPVSDASASDPNRRGSHWSLLLVDRRERARPAAYHYDSAVGYNDGPAALLAQRLGARLELARMTQQSNGYDCGVFVLDGTRALVRGLAQRGRSGVLHLDNLVVDRLALQTRLRR